MSSKFAFLKSYIGGEIPILITDAVFSYFLFGVKSHVKVTLGDELSLDFAQPQKYDVFPLVAFGLFTIFVSFSVDNFVGKYYTMLRGIFMAFTASFCCAVHTTGDLTGPVNESLMTIGSFAVFFYVATAPARNVFILEQTKDEDLRLFIFLLVFLRLLGRGLFLIIHIYVEHLSINYILAGLVILAYYVLFTAAYEKILYFEPIYFNIFFKCFSCFVNALRHLISMKKVPVRKPIPSSQKGKSGNQSKKPSRFLYFFPTFSTKKVQKAGKITKKYPRSLIRSLGTYSEKLKKKSGIRNLLDFSDKRTEESINKIKSGILLTEKERTKLNFKPKTPYTSTEMLQNFQESLFQKKNLYGLSLFRKIVFPTPVEARILNVESENVQEDRGYHWLDRARPENSEYVIGQTIRLYKILPFLLLGFSFSCLNYYFLYVTLHQSQVVKRSSNQHVDNLSTIAYYIGLEVIFYPIVEFLVLPLVLKIFKTDIFLFLCGYFSLIVAFVIVIGTQLSLMTYLPYIPGPFRSQIRIFNGMETPLNVHSSDFSLIIPPYEFKLHQDIHATRRAKEIVIEGSNISNTIEFTFVEKETISYIIEDFQVTRNAEHDPSMFTESIGSNENQASYFFVSAHHVIERCKFYHKNYSSEQNVSEDFNEVYKIRQGIFKVELKLKNQTVKISKTEMKSGGLYCIFVFRTKNKYDARIMYLEGPNPVVYASLLPQIAFGALANALATVSYFRFVFQESPQKLRCTIFGLFFMLNFGSLALASTNVFLVHVLYGEEMHFLIPFICVHMVLFIWSIYISSEYYPEDEEEFPD